MMTGLIDSLKRRFVSSDGGVLAESSMPVGKHLEAIEEKPTIKNETVIAQSLADVLREPSGDGPSGYVVNERTVMCVSAVYACVGLIAGAFECMPIQFFKKTEDGRERLQGHPLSWLLNCEPYTTVSAAVFWEYLVSSYLLHGDAFARIIRPSLTSPDIVGFEPWHPSNVEVLKVDGRLKYILTNPDSGNRIGLDQDDMLHVPGLGFNGRRGMSLISHALRSSAGIALAANDYSASFFANGARPDFAIINKGDQNLTSEQVQQMRESWDAVYKGPGKQHRPAILDGGLELKELSLSAEDAALIEQRKFQVGDVACIFGVPPFMIGQTEKQTSFGTGVEGMSINFVKFTIMRHARKFEQEISRKTLRSKTQFASFNAAAIERGDLKTRYEAYRVALGRAGEPGFKTVNEIRKLENDPPIEGGDELNRGTNDQTNSQAAGE